MSIPGQKKKGEKIQVQFFLTHVQGKACNCVPPTAGFLGCEVLVPGKVGLPQGWRRTFQYP